MFQELKVKNRVAYTECVRLSKIIPTNKECKMDIIEEINGLDETFKEIILVFIISLLFIIPAAYILGMLSLRPMRDSIETIDNFIDGIIHDINTPLSNIKLNTQSLSARLDGKYEQKAFRILQSIENIEELQEQLLFSLKSEQYTLKKTLFEVSNLLKQRVPYYNDIRNSVQIELSLDKFSISADKKLFIRLIDNLVLNAIKFSPQGSKVKIYNNNDILIIEDFGKGIKNPQDIFNKYYKEDKKTKGLGLGLFIVQSIVELHGIAINVESNVGRGSKFSIDLINIKAA